MKRSDLICENAVINAKESEISVHKTEICGTKIERINIEDKDISILNKPKGIYYTIYIENENVIDAFSSVLASMLPKGKALVVGIGNSEIASDRLGTASLSYIPATAHLVVHEDFRILGLREVSVISAGVTGKTGIESSDFIRCVAAETKAEFIIAIDSLACSERERLCKTIQLTNSGISPGSGVGNNRKRLDKEICGIPVIAVGIPTVIDYCDDCEEKLMVTPRNIDAYIRNLSEIVGIGISMALNPTLTEKDIRRLII